ncbi:MAG: ORC1-type DNA replication protein [Methanocalculaceae archaeon]|nr:ORC1-type DNA replication protein [Methanocalculaceae archaeon]
MKKNLLMWDQTLFKEIQVFDIDYIPEQFEYRDEQIQELAYAIRPALAGGHIFNTVCRGIPGTGKTTSVKKLFGEVIEITKKIVPIHINCQIDSSKYAIFSRIYTQLTKNSQPPTGTSFKMLFDMIAKYIKNEEITPIICLDDANYLVYEKELNKILYTLLRSHETYKHVRIGVIVIISDPDIDLELSLDARVASVFRPQTIHFAPYTAQEISGILSQRVMQGLYPNVLAADLLDRIIDRTMKCGDIRIGLNLIKRSVMNAEKTARMNVTNDDVTQALSISHDLRLTELVNILSTDETNVLFQLAAMTTNVDVITTKSVHTALGEKAIGYTRYVQIIEKLDHLRLVTLTYQNVGLGRTRIISLRYDPKQILSLQKPKATKK